MENLEALQLVVAVHDQLRLVAVHPHQHHVLRALVRVAAHQLVGRSLCEKLEYRDVVNHEAEYIYFHIYKS